MNRLLSIKLKKYLVITVTVCVSMLLTGCTLTKNIGKVTTEQPKDDITVKNEESDIVEESGDGRYSIVLDSTPEGKPDYGGQLTVKVTVKNLDITPFITNIGTESCLFTDEKGNVYGSTYMNEHKLKKALLIGEEEKVTIENGQISIHTNKEGEVSCENPNNNEVGQDWTRNTFKCFFNSQGECVCEDLGPLKVQSCIFRVSTDGKQASAGWGKYPLVVSMEY